MDEWESKPRSFWITVVGLGAGVPILFAILYLVLVLAVRDG